MDISLLFIVFWPWSLHAGHPHWTFFSGPGHFMGLGLTDGHHTVDCPPTLVTSWGINRLTACWTYCVWVLQLLVTLFCRFVHTLSTVHRTLTFVALYRLGVPTPCREHKITITLDRLQLCVSAFSLARVLVSADHELSTECQH